MIYLFLYQIQVYQKGVSMDTKFSVALHILTMISESRETLSSQNLAAYSIYLWYQRNQQDKA